MHNRLYRLSHGIMTALACLFMVLVFLLNAFVRGRFPVRSIEEKSCFAC